MNPGGGRLCASARRAIRDVALVALIISTMACGLPGDAKACKPMSATDVVYLDGARFFQAAFDQTKCESSAITASDVVGAGTLAVLAPSPGFDQVNLVVFVEHFLEPAGLRPTSVYYYMLSEDRVGVAHLGVIGSLEESLESALTQLQTAQLRDETTFDGTPVPFVLLLEVEATDESRLAAALAALAESEYAFQTGRATSAPPPFDPARDQVARDRSEEF